MDDVTLLAPNPEGLSRLVNIVLMYARDLAISVFMAKAVLWCSPFRQIDELARLHGFTRQDTVVAFGGEWPCKRIFTESKKDMNRIARAHE